MQKVHPDTKLRPTESGYSNNEISLEWIQHFEQHSKKSQKGSQRLLILDRHGSHYTKQFIRYCEDHGIIPFGLPPYFTHLLQPLDVVVSQPHKQWHAKALDQLVHDGLTNITKLEFNSIIEDVRIRTFKATTIQSAFKKTGIYPFNPHLILQEVDKRRPRMATPSPQPSSSITTLTTLYQINKVAEKFESSLADLELEISPSFARDIGRFFKASIINATELTQVKRDLGRTRYAKRVHKQRRARNDYLLQSGGVLTVAKGREMVAKKVDDKVVKAQRFVDAHNDRIRKATKKTFNEAAKEAKKRRLTGVRGRTEAVESGLGSRLLLRF